MKASWPISLLITLTKEGRSNSHYWLIRKKNIPWKKTGSIRPSLLHPLWKSEKKEIHRACHWNCWNLTASSMWKNRLILSRDENTISQADTFYMRLGKRAEVLVFSTDSLFCCRAATAPTVHFINRFKVHSEFNLREQKV